MKNLFFDEEFKILENKSIYRPLLNSNRGLFRAYEKDIPQGYKNNLTTEQKRDIDSIIVCYGDKSEHWVSNLVSQEREEREFN